MRLPKGRKRLRHLKPKRKRQSIAWQIIKAFIFLWLFFMAISLLISLSLIAG